jgi:GH43 family beta-xylosidase
MFLDDDGRMYMYCTCYVPFSSIRVSPMTDPLTVAGPWEIVIRPPLAGWEGIVTEGPWMVKHNAMYYLMYSGNSANLPLYAIGYATADDPMGPFTKYERNPILRADRGAEFYGPGHNSAAAGLEGELLMFYHTKIYDGVGWEREPRMNKLAFDKEGALYVVLEAEVTPCDLRNEQAASGSRK